MPEEKSTTKDVVKTEKYNEAIETINSEKMKREKVEAELKELKDTAEKKKAISKEKASWKEEKETMEKEISELKKTKVTKGKTKDKTTTEAKPVTKETITTQLDEMIPTKDIRTNFGGPIDRLKYFKSPATRKSNSQLLGRILSLDVERQMGKFGKQEPLHPRAAKRKDDNVVAEHIANIANQ